METDLLVDEAGAVHVIDDAGGGGGERIALVMQIDEKIIDRIFGGVGEGKQSKIKQNNK